MKRAEVLWENFPLWKTYCERGGKALRCTSAAWQRLNLSSISIPRGRNDSEERNGTRDEKERKISRALWVKEGEDERYFLPICVCVCKMMCYVGHVKIDLPLGNWGRSDLSAQQEAVLWADSLSLSHTLTQSHAVILALIRPVPSSLQMHQRQKKNGRGHYYTLHRKRNMTWKLIQQDVFLIPTHICNWLKITRETQNCIKMHYCSDVFERLHLFVQKCSKILWNIWTI